MRSLEVLAPPKSSPANRLLVRAVVALDPRHTFVKVPPYSIVLLRDDLQISPVAVARTAHGPNGVEIPPAAAGGGVSMTSVALEAHFTGVSLQPGTCCRVAVLDPEGRPLLVRPIPAAFRHAS